MNQDLLEHIPAKASGDDFEEFFWGLLRRKYPQTDLIYLPAQMGGDHGIEGFSTDGIAYQCYADQDSLSLRVRTDKQKKKLYDDTVKLKTNSEALRGVLGGLKIKYYFLCVPQYHAAELVKYAQERAVAVRGYGLDWIDEAFAVRIKTHEDYPAELQAALQDGVAKSIIPPTGVSGESISGFGADEPELSANLDLKLEKLKSHNPTTDTVALREQLVRCFLDKEQMLAHLRSWPETLEAIEIQRQLRQESLETDSALNLDEPPLRLKTLLTEYTAQLAKSCAGITAADASRLARGQTGDWLMRCPMSFQEKQ